MRRLRRLRGRGWALIPAGSIVAVIFAIRYLAATATWLSYLALVAVPVLAALALGWVARGARPWLALLAPCLFAVTWASPHSLAGESAGALLTALSCVTLGVLLAAVTPSTWLKFGIVAMACADVWLVGSGQLQAPNSVLAAAHPAGGLPQLQSEQFGSVSMGYGDLFVAALLGGVYVARVTVQRLAAVITLAVAALFDLLFLVVDSLPATVPVALALAVVSVCCDRSKPVDATPPRAT